MDTLWGADWYHAYNPQGRGWNEYQWVKFPEYQRNDFKNNVGDVGWKFHISATTTEAQDALCNLARKYKIHAYKKWHDPAELQSTTYSGKGCKQYGKTFVAYCGERDVDGKTIDWKAFVEEADILVRQHGGGGMPVRGDRKVPGTEAVYYRCDRDEYGYYLSRAYESELVHNGEAEIGLRYLPDHSKPDPFEKMRIGAANGCTNEQLAMLHAVYASDIEAVGTLLEHNKSLAAFRDPGTGKTMMDIADELAAIEIRLREQGEEVFAQAIRMPLVLSGKVSAQDYDIPHEVANGKIAALGNVVLCGTRDRAAAEKLCRHFKKEGIFEKPAVNRTKWQGMPGVLVPVAEFQAKFPALMAELQSKEYHMVREAAQGRVFRLGNAALCATPEISDALLLRNKLQDECELGTMIINRGATGGCGVLIPKHEFREKFPGLFELLPVKDAFLRGK